MTTIPLGDFAPAASSFNQGAIDTVRGMQPVRDGWGKFNQFVHQSDALSGAVIGGIEAIDPSDGTIYIYTATVSGMARINTGDSPWSWTDATNSSLGSYTLSAESLVSHTVFGDKLIAANGGFPGLQVATIGSGDFSTISGAPTARFVATFADRVWALGQVATPNRVEWSAPRNHTIWGDTNKGADFQMFESGGEVVGGGVVGDLLYVFQTDAIQGFMRQGTVITRQEIRQKFGCASAQSIVEAPGGIFFLSEDGFYLAGPGGSIQPIGAQIVDSWFMGGSEVDLTKLWAVQGAHDPANKLVIWRYPRPGFAGVGFTDRAIGYNYELGKWFPLALEGGFLMRASSPGLFSDGISDLSDTINLSIDSRVYDGGRPQLAGFDNQFRFGFFSGGAMEAEIETANIQFATGRRAFVSGFRPIVEGTNNYTGAIGVKATPTDATAFNSLTTPNRGGMITQRGDGLSHKFKINIPAGEAWSALTAIEVDGVRTSGWA